MTAPAELEPGIAATVARLTDAERATAAADAMVEWSAYRQCPTCRAPMGEPCYSASGRIVGGQPDGIRTALPHAHAHRRRRSGR